MLFWYGANMSELAAIGRNKPHGDAAHCRVDCLLSRVLACVLPSPQQIDLQNSLHIWGRSYRSTSGADTFYTAIYCGPG